MNTDTTQPVTVPRKSYTRPLYRIEELSDVYVDACIRDHDGDLLFMSAYGRDGMLMHLLSAFTLGNSEHGLRDFHLVDTQGERHLVSVGDASHLDKHSGRLPKQNLFGPISQMWIFKKILNSPDMANRISWVLDYQETSAPVARVDGDAGTDFDTRCWNTLQHLSPIPLLDPWRERIMAWCWEKGVMMGFNAGAFPTLGTVSAVRVSLGQHFVTAVSEMVKAKQLTLDE